MHNFFIEALAGAGSNVNGSLGGPYKATNVSLDLPSIAAAIKGSRCCRMRTVSWSPVVSALRVSRAPVFFVCR